MAQISVLPVSPYGEHLLYPREAGIGVISWI
jgi:hypothetical protein